MSASICWEPASPAPRTIGVWAPSAFMAAMERAGMGLPCTLTREHEPVLRGMAAIGEYPEGSPNPYLELIKAIEASGATGISVWAEH